jgi:hypothetical protein
MTSQRIKQICLGIVAVVAAVVIGTITIKEINEKAYFFSRERRRQRLEEREIKEERRTGRRLKGFYRREKRVRDEWYEQPEELLEAEEE